MRRKMLGLTQHALADALYLTFQQVLGNTKMEKPRQCQPTAAALANFEGAGRVLFQGAPGGADTPTDWHAGINAPRARKAMAAL
jgi:hypothetical protein